MLVRLKGLLNLHIVRSFRQQAGLLRRHPWQFVWAWKRRVLRFLFHWYKPEVTLGSWLRRGAQQCGRVLTWRGWLRRGGHRCGGLRRRLLQVLPHATNRPWPQGGRGDRMAMARCLWCLSLVIGLKRRASGLVVSFRVMCYLVFLGV